ncbi:hypothetical protein SMC26_38630 [Actinomadura fulvescens]|uniref:hypothetical protein n=1 Tax=Actinomadura fulvescens TaxID=46160 RepID=UPI0031D7AAAF
MPLGVPHANADVDRSATRFSDFAADLEVAAGMPQARYRGRLVFTGSNGSEQGLAGASVRVGSEIARTDTQGWFAGLVPNLRAGEFKAMYAGAAEHSASASAPVPIMPGPLKTRVSVNVPRGPFEVGQRVTVSGRLEYEDPRNGWRNLPGGALDVGFYKFRSNSHVDPVKVTTGVDGAYRLDYRIPASGNFNIMFREWWATWERAYEQSDSEDAGDLTAFRDVKIKLRKDRRVEAKGRLVRPRKSGSTYSVANGIVWLESATDFYAASVRTDKNGYFLFRSHSPVRAAFRVAYYGGNSSSNASRIDTDLRAYSASTFLDAREPTRFVSFNAGPEPVRKGRALTLTGLLQYSDRGRWLTADHRRAEIWFRPRGSKKWVRAAQIRADNSGVFRKVVTARRDGYWRIVFRGDLTFRPVYSAIDYVDVR